MIERRTLLIGLAVLAAPSIAIAQQPAAKVPRIGVIGDQSPKEPRIEAFRQGLRELGYIEGKNIVIEYRYAYGVVDRFAELTAELLALKVDVLVVGGAVTAHTAKNQTTTVPIIFAIAGDPVGTGLVTSLSRPGGNVTGLSALITETSSKQLELLKAIAPKISRVAILINPVNSGSRLAVTRTREAARALALDVQVVEVRRRNELASAFAALTAWRAGAVLVVPDPMFGNELIEISRLAATYQLPAIYNRREFAEAGGLLAYGPSYSDNYRRAATYVDKILRGAKPADLPVEQPTRFELVINLKTAKLFGITIPQSVLVRADEVIE